ncbi:50S ribosomal protein L9 [Salinisphaera sp. PC39]|uniref:50S ribosomal protein L9 n=1 Tax=Salinisphaera sp. PC39 TaxID=1304156 RepID=UPI00333F8170
MQVILLQKVRNLGDLGDQVKVRPGYGRNFLVPKGYALPATPENIKVFEARRSELMAASQERLDRARGRAEKLGGSSFVVAMRASDEGKLYGSVGPQEIVDAVAEEGHELDAREVVLPDGPLRTIGRFQAVIQLHAEVETEIEVVVAQLTDLGINMPPERAAEPEEAEQTEAETAEAAAEADETGETEAEEASEAPDDEEADKA